MDFVLKTTYVIYDTGQAPIQSLIKSYLVKQCGESTVERHFDMQNDLKIVKSFSSYQPERIVLADVVRYFSQMH